MKSECGIFFYLAMGEIAGLFMKFCNFALSNNNGDATPALIRIQG